MIFVTVGTHNQGFDRLVKAADLYAAGTPEQVVIQKGASSYAPQHAESFDFAPSQRIHELSAAARVIVTHAGAGSILTSLTTAATVVVVPRLKRYGEHLDDHQLELAEALHREGKAHLLTDLAELPSLLESAPTKKSTLAEAPLIPYLRTLLTELARRRTA